MHHRNLQNACGRQACLVRKAAPAVNKKLGLLHQVGAAAFHQCAQRQLVLARQFLCPQFLFQAHRRDGATHHRAVAGAHHDPFAGDDTDANDTAAGLHTFLAIVVVHAQAGEEAELEKVAAGVDEARHAFAWREGAELSPQNAHGLGLLQGLARNREDLMAQARAWIAANPKAQQPWDAPKFRFPGGDSRAPAVAQMWSIAPSIAATKSQGNYPAVPHIMGSIFEGRLLGFDAACEVESRYFAACAISQVSKNMVGTLWSQLNALKKGASRPVEPAPSKVKKLGVVGAGMMGASIAYVSAKFGIDVVLLDTTQDAAAKGTACSQGLLDQAVKRGRSTPEDRDALLARIRPTTVYADLAGCDLVIEAVFEDRGVKAGVTQQAEAVLGERAMFASNTSTLPITGLAQTSMRPASFIGLHFSSPVDKMPLVEIIAGEETSDATLALGFDYVLQIGKTPIVVNDSRGVYTSRVFGTYVMEGIAMLKEGVHPRSIEMAGLQAGMPMPPLALQDEVSLSLSLHVDE